MELPELKTFKFRDMDEIPARDWIIASWLPAAELAALHGVSGIGSSTLALRLAAAIAEGRRDWLPGALELEPAEPAAAVFVSLNDDERTHAFRLQRAGVKPTSRLWFVGGHNRGALFDGEPTGAGKALLAECERLNARLLVVDPKAIAFRGNYNRNFIALREWAWKAECAVLVAGTEDADWPDWPARAVWQLKRRAGGATLECDWTNYAVRPEPVQLAGSDPARWKAA